MKQLLPARLSLDQLKHQAKDLLKEFRAGSQPASVRFREHHPHPPDRAAIALNDAQLVIAHEYGFASWPKLKHHVEALAAVSSRITQLQSEFVSGDIQTRLRLLQPAHAKERFENYDPNAASLSDADARLIIANQEGYAFWNKYDSYLHLDPAVQTVISAVRAGDLSMLHEILHSDPAAANPKWVSSFAPPAPIP